MNRYTVRFQPWDSSWCLSGPVGANGQLRFKSAREAASHARWAARRESGETSVYDPKGQLCRTITIDADQADEDGLVSPSI